MPRLRLPRSSRFRFKRKQGVSTVIGTLIFVLILLMGLTTIATVFSYYNSYNTQLVQYNQSSLQRGETSLTINNLAFGASANTGATSTSLNNAYVAITLTNSQASATPATFQEKIVFNPSTYSTYEGASLGNIRFCLDPLCPSKLFAWLESCTPSCTTAATSATAWVKLTSSIAGSGGTLTVYMVFQPTATTFDGNYWGEAPTLSGSYGQYDNGANVFTFYDNFAGISLSGKWTTVTSGGSFTVNNGITISSTSATHYSFIYSATQAQPNVAEAYMVSVASDSPLLGLETLALTNSKGIYNGYSLNWWSGTDSLCPEKSSGIGTCVTHSNAFPAGIWSVYWASAGTEGATDGSGNSLSTADNTVGAIANYGIYLGAYPDGTGSNVVQWARVRAHPPSNVLPSTSFGAAVPILGVASSYNTQNKVVYALGLWWVFYSDGTNIVYRTSADGSVWSSATTVTSSADSTKGYDFSIWTSGTTIYYALDAYGQSASFFWRYGTLQSAGTISWTISETSVSTSNTVYSYSSIVTDSGGNVWVALNTNDGTNTHLEVWRYSSSTWSKVDDLSPLSSDETPILVPLTTGVALIYGEGSVTAPVKVITSATGSSWSAPISPTSDYMLFSSSATSISNSVYFAGLASGSAGVTTGTINFWSFASGAGSTSPETQLQATTSGWSVSISDEPSKTLIVFYGSGVNVYSTSSVNFGTSWTSAQTISSTETSVTGINSAEDGIGVLWTSGGSSPFNIRFAALPMLSTINNTPFAVHMISLYILNTVTNTLTHFDTNSSAPGVAAAFDNQIGTGETMSIPLSYFAWTTSQSYVITLTTDQGVTFTSSLTSPS